MVSETVVEAVLPVVLALGAPVLVGLFYAEGLVVGKLLQPPAVFIAYVAVAAPSWQVLFVVAGSCVVAATLGQWTLYRGFAADAPEFFGLRRRVPYLDDLPGIVDRRVGDRQLPFVEGVFARYGALGICLTNAVPGIRCLVSIPAGLASYHRGYFLVATTVGNVLYVGLLVGVALGLVELTRFLIA